MDVASNTSNARFLGWRRNVSGGNSSRVSPEGFSSRVTPSPQFASVNTPRGNKNAIWSDMKLLENTDGFDLKQWQSEFQYSSKRQQAPSPSHRHDAIPLTHGSTNVTYPTLVRRVVKAVAENSAAGFASLECPIGLMKAMDMMHPREANDISNFTGSDFLKCLMKDPASLAKESKACERRAIWIGQRTPRQPASELKRLPEHRTKQTEEEALVALADFGEQAASLCRGTVGETAMKQLQARKAELKQRRLECIEEANRRSYKRLQRWRQQQETCSSTSSEDSSLATSPSQIDLEDKQGRLTSVLGRLKRGVPSSILVRRISASAPCPDFLQAAAAETESKSSPCSNEVKARVREFLLKRVEERKKIMNRMMNKRQQRKSCFEALPTEERAAIAMAFDLHKSDDGTIGVDGSMKALRELGLRGNTMHERANLEYLVSDLSRTLMEVEERGLENSPLAPGMQTWWHSKKQEMHRGPITEAATANNRRTAEIGVRRKQKRSMARLSALRAGYSAPDHKESPTEAVKEGVDEKTGFIKASHRPIGLPLEAFGAEIVPSVRFELYDLRTELHFRYFAQELESGPRANSSGLTPSQYQKVLNRLQLDKLTGPKPPPPQRFTEVSDSASNDSNEETIIDFELFHTRLTQLEEMAGRAASAKEQKVAQSVCIDEALFQLHWLEFPWLYNIYLAFDGDGSGYLTHDEACRVLKHIGLQPYQADTNRVIERCFKEIDEDGHLELDFGEFLVLLHIVRKHQMRNSRHTMREKFASLELDSFGRIPFAELVAALAKTGLLQSRNEYRLAAQFIDQEFDVGAHLHTSENLPAQPRSSRRGSVSARGRDAGSLDFGGFLMLHQRVSERLATIEGERILNTAAFYRFGPEEFSEIQKVFDVLDEHCTGKLSIENILLLTQQLLDPTPDRRQFFHYLATLQTDMDALDIHQCLQLLHLIIANLPSGLTINAAPFTLRNSVPPSKQRQLLSLFPIALSYISGLPPGPLLEMLSDFLAIHPDQDMKKLSTPIYNVRKLWEFALSLAEHHSKR